jgi:hypothetical protein
LRIEKPLDEANWSAGYRVDLWAGPDVDVLGTQSFFGGNSKASAGDFAIRQAYVLLRMPVGNGIDWKIGVFDSILGYESIESPLDPNFTRSYGHSMEPQTHTGVLATYHFNDVISVSAGVADTIGSGINERAQIPNATTLASSTVPTTIKSDTYKTYMTSVALTAPSSMGFLAGSTLYAGIVNGFKSADATISPNGDQTSWYIGTTLTTPVTGLRFGAAFDYEDIDDAPGQTYSVAGYGSYQITEKLSLHTRAEFLKDSTGLLAVYYGQPDTARILSLTATVQYDLWANVLSRLELRWDHDLTGTGIWGGTMPGSTGTLQNEWLLAANVVYKF